MSKYCHAALVKSGCGWQLCNSNRARESFVSDLACNSIDHLNLVARQGEHLISRVMATELDGIRTAPGGRFRQGKGACQIRTIFI